ncbi:glycoside hydrolase family 95 protein [Maribacter ulvicola]|uniref:Alpha-L-fucosidase 2 n=1 Tax=Maribacter ulvicola TaxID=228959 RepID=A0A1N6Y902_9FLAO|nr:glycoside hydrolase family 95 protein [Maribacter ulvicola]SIR10996.1 alpha-L-fucosidase 2 [Maribacter ulvicola]
MNSSIASENADLKLWYDKEAKSWMREALPIGNAFMGAMVFGGVEREHIQLNEESLWAGGPGEWDQYNGGNREGAYKHLNEVRNLLSKREFDKAHALASKELSGKIKGSKNQDLWEGFGAYQTFGDLYIDVEHAEKISEYRRELNISKALAGVSYKSGTVSHKRTYFASYPHNALVFQFKNNSEEGIDYTINFKSLHENVTYSRDGNVLVVDGAVENNGMGFGAKMLIESKNGNISFNGSTINIKKSNSVVLKLVMGTSYSSSYPEYTGNNYKEKNTSKLEAIKNISFESLKKGHMADYANLFKRVRLNLDGEDKNYLPTDKRLRLYASGERDPKLESLYFQYGRYLLISSSRPGSLPANLQGKWNDKNAPPWASDYHMNINLEMIYWPAEVTNLSDCHEPLIKYVETLIAPGKKSALDFFNADGWVVNTMNNPFGYTAPGWGFPWGFFPGGAGWLSQHVWAHYDFNKDERYLKEQGFPIMKESALFWLDYLVEDEMGYLVSSPSYSPEHGGISSGASMDLQIVWDLFTNCLRACEILDIKDNFYNEVKEARSKLLLPKIGKWGQLQEWKEDVDDPESKHRHISHLFALYPGHQISLEKTPNLAKAAKVSLEARGDEGTGWSLGWKINFWARLHDGNRAHKILKRLLKPTTDEGFEMVVGGGTYDNLLCAHPPFQLDGNMGGTAGIAEMLLQSQSGEINILPALPDAWPTGTVKGLKARGGFEVDINWTQGKLEKILLKSPFSQSVKIRYNNKVIELDMVAGQAIRLNDKLVKK